MFKRIKIRSYEVGLKFRDGEFKSLMAAGTHWLFDPLGKIRVRVVSKREPWLADEQLDVIVKSGALTDKAEVLDLKDNQRALVWNDGRFARIQDIAGSPQRRSRASSAPCRQSWASGRPGPACRPRDACARRGRGSGCRSGPSRR